MPRRKMNIVTTEPWPAIRKGSAYQVRIKSVTLNKAAGFLQVTVENLHPEQLGRTHEAKLPLPLRPGNRTCAFLAACGIDATAVGTTVDLDRIAGIVVGMRLRGFGADDAQEFDFEPVARRPAARNTEMGVTESKDTAAQ
jgi:hypothetical protein